MEDTGAAAHKDISSITSGTNVLMKTNVSVHTFVEEHPATILWEAINVCALLDFSMSSLVEVAKISMNAVLHKPHAVTAAQTLKVATSVDVHLVTSE